MAPLFGNITKKMYSNLPKAVSLQQAQCTCVRHVARHERTVEVCFVKCGAVDSREERLLSLNVKASAGVQRIRAHWTLAVHWVGDVHPHSRGVGGIGFLGPSDFMPPPPILGVQSVTLFSFFFFILLSSLQYFLIFLSSSLILSPISQTLSPL